MQSILTLKRLRSQWRPTMPFYFTPEQDDFTQELQFCIAEALYDAGREDQLTGTMFQISQVVARGFTRKK